MTDKLSNGLIKKDMQYVDCIQDLEKYEKKSLNPEQNIKKIIINQKDIPSSPDDVLKNFYIIENQMWFDFGRKYIICQNTALETVEYIKENKKFILGYLDEPKQVIQLVGTIVVSI